MTKLKSITCFLLSFTFITQCYLSTGQAQKDVIGTNEIKAKPYSDVFPALYQRVLKEKLQDKYMIKLSNKQLEKTLIITINGKLEIVNNNGETINSIDLKSMRVGKLSETNIKWSPDGKNMIFLATNLTSGKISWYIMNVDGTLKEILKNEQALQPTWAPDNEHIAFIRIMRGVPGANIFIKNIFSGKETSICESGGGNPQWFNHHSKILYKKMKDPFGHSKDQDLFVFDVARKNHTKILDGPIFITYPPISPDDSKILVCVGSKTRIIDTNGQLLKEFEIIVTGDPLWSPNSDFIAYLKAKIEGDPGVIESQHIYLLDTLTGSIKNLTPISYLVIESFQWYNNNTIIY